MVGCSSAKGQPDLAVRWQLQPHRECTNGVETGVERVFRGGPGGHVQRRVERAQGLARVAVAAKPAEAVGLHAQRRDGRVVLDQEVRREQALFGRQTRLAFEHQRLLCRAPAGAHEEVREGRVRFVGAGVGEGDLEHRHQLEIERALAQVAQLDLAELDVVFGADPDRGVGVDLGPGRVETHPVCVVGALVVRGRVGCRVLGQRHGLRLAVPAQVEEAAMPVTQGIVAPARDAEAAPAAPAGAVGAQRHAVAAVGKQVGGRQRGDTRQHLAQQAGCAAFLLVGRRAGWRCEQHRHFAWRTFVQQRRHRFHMRVAHTPAPRRTVQQHVGNGHDAHALVVRHEGVDAGEADCRSLACSAEIERFDKTVTRPRGQRFERCEVRYRAVRLDLRCKRSGVRRDHQFVGRGAAQGQAWHTLRCVLVGQRVVTRGVGRLGNAPGHVVFAREADLLVQRGEAGAVQHAALWFFEHQRRHQVLEHRTRPRAQAGVFTDRIERPAERGPVAHRHVALGDGQQAGQARFRRQ